MDDEITCSWLRNKTLVAGCVQKNAHRLCLLHQRVLQLTHARIGCRLGLGVVLRMGSHALLHRLKLAAESEHFALVLVT